MSHMILQKSFRCLDLLLKKHLLLLSYTYSIIILKTVLLLNIFLETMIQFFSIYNYRFFFALLT